MSDSGIYQPLFTLEQMQVLALRYTDAYISKLTGISYDKVVTCRTFYKIPPYIEHSGYATSSLTGEIRRKGSFKGLLRSDNLDQEFFKIIDTPEKAYWLGFLLADGWVSFRNDTPKEVGLAVKASDIKVLEDFKLATGSSHNIVTKVNKNSLSTSKLSTLCTLRITSQTFCKYAVEAGILPKKSRNLILPESALKFPDAFCRGFFDGDGSICARNFCFICGSDDFAQELGDLIYINTGVELKYASLISPTSKNSIPRISGYLKDKEVLDWMYKNPNPSLERKLAIYEQYWK